MIQAVFANGDSFGYGYDLDRICPVFEQSIDSVYRRRFNRRMIETGAMVALGAPLLGKILVVGLDSLFATHLLVPNPDIDGPSEVTIFETIHLDYGDHFVE